MSGPRSVFREIDQPANPKTKQKRTTKERYRPGRVYLPVYAKKSLNGVSTDFATR